MREPIRVFIPAVGNAAQDAAAPPPIQPLPTPLSMRVHTQAHLLAEMAIGGVPFTDADLALLSLRVKVIAEEIEGLEAEARRSRR